MGYTAKKKNRVLTIPEEKADEYAKMGYEVTDDDGEVVATAAVTSVEEAQKIARKLAKESEEKDSEIAELQKENEELKEKLKEAAEYAEKADLRIAELQKENEDLKRADKESEHAVKNTAKTGKKSE
ncbi:MAG: hypothetical protein ACI4EO_01620 [Blautia sp.]